MEKGAQSKQADMARFARLFERLREGVPDYEFFEDRIPYHSSYDNWHFFGRRKRRVGSIDTSRKTSVASATRPASSRTRSDYGTTDDGENDDEEDYLVVARVSIHTLRLEREFKQAQVLNKARQKEERSYFVKPLQLCRLDPRKPGDKPMAVSVVEAPGENYLIDIVELGPNFYAASPTERHDRKPRQIPLLEFLDFAIGASECCEILHHGHEMVHGELRGDAFHYDKQSGVVRLINFGSGARSFEHGLTSVRWSSLSTERGVEHKLQFIAPEQTGRLPAEPDSRTDIYSLGILFWTMLTGEAAFDGSTPLEIMQNVLSRRIVRVTTIRPDVPDALSAVIQKMTCKAMDERYNSVAGVKYDLKALRKILTDGDSEALDQFQVGSNDVSSFFMLPAHLVGREQQHKQVVDIIERAAQRAARAAPLTKKGLWSLSSGASVSSSERPDLLPLEDLMSDSTSSGDRDRDRDSRILSHPDTPTPETRQVLTPRDVASEPSSGGDAAAGKSLEHHSSIESRASLYSHDALSKATLGYGSTMGESSSVSRTAQKLKRKGRTEVVVISGNAGFGKSTLVTSIQSVARQHGYFASAKFDQVKNSPFEPVMRIMSSLFRQIFSENDVSTPFHDNIRALVKPVWSVLHTYLDLPEWLLASGSVSKTSPQNPSSRVSGGTGQGFPGKKACNTASTQEWLRTGGSNKSSRFMFIYMDVLRLLAVQKFICLCMDDLQFADQESLDLLQNIVAARIPIVLMLTHRADEVLSPKILQLIENATIIELGPFTDDECGQYVADTLSRAKEYCLPLVAVIQEKTLGNPFFVREMLDSCYRKKCIFFCWRCLKWEFSLDKVFDEFSSSDATKFSSSDFIARRLNELPTDTQALLAWAAIMGNHFSFNMVKYVMSCSCSKASPKELIPPTSTDPVHGLQNALNSFFIMSTNDDDDFKFAHDRYLAAAAKLCDRYRLEEMHYVISCAMMKHVPYDAIKDSNTVLFSQATHICRSIEVIKHRQKRRAAHRELLFQAAETARESEARAVSLHYYENCMQLLSDDPWNSAADDSSYVETLTLFAKTAESYWYMGRFDEASAVLTQIFDNAKTPTDKVPAAIIKSRMFVGLGNTRAAFLTLRHTLGDMGVQMPSMTWEDCDKEFQRLIPLILADETDIEAAAQKPIDTELTTLGALMVELCSASFWTESLLFFQTSLKLMDIYLQRGTLPQAGIGFVHMASISVYRYNLMEVGNTLGDKSLRFFAAFGQEFFTIARGLTTHALFLGHLHTGLREQFPFLNRALDASVAAGDKIMHLLNLGVIAVYRIWVSEDMQEVEAYVLSVADEVPDWQKSMRGGGFLLTARQYSRALQGKTQFRSADTIFCDGEHTTDAWVAYVNEHASSPKRATVIYHSFRVGALYRYGYYKEALALGERIMPELEECWCMRFVYSVFFYKALSFAAILREQPDREDRQKILDRVLEFHTKIEVVTSRNPVNYEAWLFLVDAEFQEINGQYEQAITAYERAIDHAVLHGFTLDEALALELYADYLIRQGAKRPARGIVLDCISAYRRVSAFGKAIHVSEKYEFLLYGTQTSAAVDAGTQTEVTDTNNTSYRIEQNAMSHGPQTSEDRTQEWLEPNSINATSKEKDPSMALSGGASAVGLDMIDLASILESSQLLSSELDVDSLLPKLIEIIVESTGAERSALCVEQDGGGWFVAATGAPDGMTPPPSGMPLAAVDDPVARQITSYVLRFREPLFLRNVLDDERFSNVPASWLKEYPEGASCITMPILHGNDELLGAVHCQAAPNSFTERTVTLLRLLVNQIAISIANALLFKKIDKVSASNASMLEVQKQALAQAREAEKKAKEAEAKAMEMVRLKDEAAKAKTMFLANVSHELRTPLNGVIGMSEMLKSTILSKEQEEHADSIRVCADTLLSIINDILDFSKLEAGKMAVFSIPLSLTETISEVVRALSYANIERGLQTVEQLDLDKHLLVMGDPVRIHQVLFNVCSNAYKFTPKGKITIKAVIDYEDAENIQITISVIDTGIGVTQEQQKKLFLPFSQADSSTARSYGGTGLGLSICKAIVENVMHGRIWLESQPGVGTTVSFTLPFKKILQSASNDQSGVTRPGKNADPMAIFTPSAADDGTSRAYISLAGIPRDELKVCIAEDNPINQKIAISFVKKLGFNCEAFADGQQAVDALERASKEGKPFHLVLMDVQMPVLDGYNATREIRKHSDPIVRDVLVIAMTASAIRGDREKCLEAGMNNYLAKPVRANTLKQMLESYLNQPAKPIPNLQQEANNLVNTVVSQEVQQNGNGSSDATSTTHLKNTTERPKSARAPSTEIHLSPEEMLQKERRDATQQQSRGSLPDRPKK